MRKLLWTTVLVAALAGMTVATAACGGGGDDDDDNANVDAGGSGPDAPTGGGPDAAVQGDGNDSFEDAQTVTVDDSLGVSGVIQEPGDRDYFKFDATAGAWLKIVTVANPMDDLEKVDTVITMYDSTMTQVAENDDAVPRLNTDSEIIIRIPTTGTYYLEVLEWTDWAGEMPANIEGDPTFTYQVKVTTVDPSGVGVVEDPETGDDAGSATAFKFDSGGGVAIGDFEDATDVDVYQLATGLSSNPITFSSAIAPEGADGYGSTAPAGKVTMTNAAGTEIIARIDVTAGPFELSPPVEPNSTYLIWIERPAGATPAANDFYVYKFFTYQGNPPEAESGTGQNDTLGTAETLTNQSGGHFIRAYIGDGDIDYFKFTVASGQKISVACAGASVGSGIQGLRAEVRDGTDTMVRGANESLTEYLSIKAFDAPAAGDYYLRLTKTGQDPEVTSTFARCGVHLQ